VEAVAVLFGPDRFESDCGIKVRGTTVLEAFAHRAEPELPGSDLVRLTNLQDGAVSVVLRVDGGIGTVVPALPGFIAGLTFKAGRLARGHMGAAAARHVDGHSIMRIHARTGQRVRDGVAGGLGEHPFEASLEARRCEDAQQQAVLFAVVGKVCGVSLGANT
jgi:hypothetical protein